MPEKNSSLHLLRGNYLNKISNIAQVGGIETSVIDNGPGRGTRIAWVNTGSGLRYKVVLDRSMDVVDAFYNQYSLAWISKTGVTPPQPFSDKSVDWLRTFGGGLCTTCGLSHVGGPDKDEFGERGLHGHISNTPAEIESIIQPDPHSGKMEMSITGRTRESRIFGPSLQLKRTISSSIGESWLRIHDEVTNEGNTIMPHMLLYHFNFGWPLVDEGVSFFYEGEKHYINEARDKHIFGSNNNFRVAPAPLDMHKGSGEAAAYFDIKADKNGNCRCAIFNHQLKMGVSLQFKKEQLRWLTHWQHWAPGEYVTGLEPGTNPPIGQAEARKRGELIFIEPGQTKTYDVRLNMISSVDEFAADIN